MNIKRIVVIGPESTGKSTLSEHLADALDTIWVPEYARGYLEERNGIYAAPDILQMAKGQVETEDAQAANANKYLICDTDLYVIKVWSEHKYGNCPPWVLEQIATRKYDLYLLTDIDMAWQDDPLREHPEYDMRQYFFTIYKDIVQQSGTPWQLISGNPEQRLAIAMAAIKKHL